jgi:hypothetical protein
MHYETGFAPQPQSRHWLRVLLLVVICALLGVAQGMAQEPARTPASAETSQAPAAAPAVAAVGTASAVDFCAVQAAPKSIELSATASSCTDSSQCLPDKLCCRACGYFGCTLMACLTPMNGHCPFIP